MRLTRFLGPANVAALIISESLLIMACYAVAVILLLPTDPVIFFLHSLGFPRLAVLTLAIILGL